MDTKRLLTLGETSSALGVSHQTVRRMVARGELAFVTTSGDNGNGDEVR